MQNLQIIDFSKSTKNLWVIIWKSDADWKYCLEGKFSRKKSKKTIWEIWRRLSWKIIFPKSRFVNFSAVNTRYQRQLEWWVQLIDRWFICLCYLFITTSMTFCETCNLDQSKSQKYSLVVLYLRLKYFRNDKYKRKFKKATKF